MRVNYYMTYNEFNKGVYNSQVIETLSLYNSLGWNFQLVALLPLKYFFKRRKWIKDKYPNSIIFPAIPTLRLLFLNIFYLLFLKSNSNIICRGSLATKIAIFYKRKFNKIIYDARSAIAEEHKEYGDGRKYFKLLKIDQDAILYSDFKLSVSFELINYWKGKFQYKCTDYMVIPCCVKKEKRGVDRTSDDFFKKIVLVFSGSTHPWQSFPLNCSFVDQVLSSREDVNVLFLTKKNHEIDEILEKYGKERVRQKWLEEYEVFDYLSLCDYGLMLRDDNITNNVSSPVKFAEYLINGLNVIISSSVKDYSIFVKNNSCGYVWNVGDDIPYLMKNIRKNENISLARKHFVRDECTNIENIKKFLSRL